MSSQLFSQGNWYMMTIIKGLLYQKIKQTRQKTNRHNLAREAIDKKRNRSIDHRISKKRKPQNNKKER